MAEFLDNIPMWLNALALLVAGCTGITALTPSKSDDEWLDRILKLLNLLAGNFGKNKNADAE